MKPIGSFTTTFGSKVSTNLFLSPDHSLPCGFELLPTNNLVNQVHDQVPNQDSDLEASLPAHPGENLNAIGPSPLNLVGPPLGPSNEKTGKTIGPSDTFALHEGTETSQNSHGDTSLAMDVFCDPAMPPLNYNLPPNFKRVFMHGVWTLVPGHFTKDILHWSSQEEDKAQNNHLEIWSGENHTETLSPNIDHLDMEDSGHDTNSSDNHVTEDSESDFEEKIKQLLNA